MKAKGIEIKEFYYNNWPSKDWYHESFDGDFDIESFDGECLLKDDQLYDLKGLGPLCWQGDANKDPLMNWSFEDAFKKWKYPKDDKTYEVIVLKVLVDDKEKLLDYVKENIKTA